MHYLTYVVIEQFDLENGYDDEHIESAVQSVLEPYHDNLWDWYEIGGRWHNDIKNNRMTVKEFKKIKDFEMPEYYFDYEGEELHLDKFYGLLELNGWAYDSPEYKDLQKKIKCKILKKLSSHKDDDLIIIVDLHN